MHFDFFDDILTHLGHKLMYEAYVNLVGNSNYSVEDSSKIVQEQYPLAQTKDKRHGETQQQLATIFGGVVK